MLDIKNREGSQQGYHNTTPKGHKRINKTFKRPAKMKGRPKSMNESLLQKLEWAFKLGATDREACNEAGISPQTLYNYQAKNPDFLEQKEAWKSSPIFKARKCVVEHLENDPNLAMKYLEKKLPKEFGAKGAVEITQKSELLVGTDDLAAFIEARNAKTWAENDALNLQEDMNERDWL